jgi:hypothetical protein
MYTVANRTTVKPEPITSMELRTKVVDNNATSSLLFRLLNTSATGTYVAASALKKIKLTIELTNIQVCGYYSSITATKMAMFKVVLPDFCNSKTITL